METNIQTKLHIRPVDVIAWKLKNVSVKNWDKYPLNLIAEAMAKGLEPKNMIAKANIL